MVCNLAPTVAIQPRGEDLTCPSIHILDRLLNLHGAFNIARRLKIVSALELLKLAAGRNYLDRLFSTPFPFQRPVETVKKYSKQIGIEVNYF